MFEPVSFQGGQSETVTLGPNSPQSSVRLSCTVTVSGSFQWTWQHNGDSLLSSERYQILTGDATRSSILVINKLNYTDEGTYSCVVNHVSQTEKSLQNFTLQLLSMLLFSFIYDTFSAVYIFLLQLLSMQQLNRSMSEKVKLSVHPVRCMAS